MTNTILQYNDHSFTQLKTRLDKDLTQLATEKTDNEVSRKIKNSDLMTDLKLLSVYSLYLLILIFTKLAQTFMQLCTYCGAFLWWSHLTVASLP